MNTVFLCSFSDGLDDIPRRKQGDLVHVLRVLAELPSKRFSVFEATENMTIARTMTRLVHQGYITTDDSPYPWTGYALTEKARAAISKASA